MLVFAMHIHTVDRIGFTSQRLFHLPAVPPPYYHPSFFFSRRPLSRNILSTSSICSTEKITSSNSTRITSTITTANMVSSATITLDGRGAIVQQDANNKQDNQENQLKKQTLLFGVRHGVSVANEYMSQPGHRWGDATFYDDVQYADAPLSVAGQQQVGRLAATLGDTLLQSLLLEQQLPPFAQDKIQEQADQCSGRYTYSGPSHGRVVSSMFRPSMP
jgi:hypothetical protein